MTRLLDTIETWFNRLLRFLIALVATSIGLFAVLIPLNLLLIKQHWGTMWWLNEAVEYALYIGVFIGAPWVLQQGAHVRIDVFVVALPRKAAARLERLLNYLGAGLCLTFSYYGTRATLWAFASGTLPEKVLQIPNWYILTVFSVSFFLLALEFLFRLRHVRVSDKKEQPIEMKASF